MHKTVLPASRHSGFTLIEALITLVILGILAAIAYPQYMQHTQKSRRADAQVALTQTAAKLEKYFFTCNTYTKKVANTLKTPVCPTDAINEGLGFADDLSPAGHYQIVIDNTKTANGTACSGGAGTCYTITATPAVFGYGGRGTGVQSQDSKCASLRIDSSGIRNSTGGGTDCWGKR